MRHRKIGWNEKTILYWRISKQLEALTSAFWNVSLCNLPYTIDSIEEVVTTTTTTTTATP